MVDHGVGYVTTWAPVQADGEDRLNLEFFDCRDQILVRWIQRARTPDGELSRVAGPECLPDSSYGSERLVFVIADRSQLATRQGTNVEDSRNGLVAQFARWAEASPRGYEHHARRGPG